MKEIHPRIMTAIYYHLRRQHFVNPGLIPCLAECILRRDFNFAKYLSFSYAKVLTDFFNTSWLSLLLMIIIMTSIRTVELDESLLSTVLNFVIPLVFVVIYYLYYRYFLSVEDQLLPELHSVEYVDFAAASGRADYIGAGQVVPCPKYLVMNKESNDILKQMNHDSDDIMDEEGVGFHDERARLNRDHLLNRYDK